MPPKRKQVPKKKKPLAKQPIESRHAQRQQVTQRLRQLVVCTEDRPLPRRSERLRLLREAVELCKSSSTAPSPGPQRTGPTCTCSPCPLHPVPLTQTDPAKKKGKKDKK